MSGGCHPVISKRDKVLIYHQRIVYLVYTDFTRADSLSWWATSLAKLIAKRISKPAKKLSQKFWRKNTAFNDTSEKNLRKNKYFVVWWAARI